VIGWLAHASEQYHHQSLVRPRAKYTGPLPD
jgi:citrate synthase